MLTSRYTIREQNEQFVIRTINQEPNISRAMVAQKTKLNKATVSDIVNKLIEEQLIVEVGSGTSSSFGGRKPILLKINKNAGAALSIDLGYDYISAILTSLDGHIIEETKEDILVTKENVIKLVQKITNVLKKTTSSMPYGITGIVLAIHGIVYENNIIFTPYYDLSKIDLFNLLCEKIDLPIYLENEANLAVLSEKSHFISHNNIVSISIHSGVGAGIIINNELYYGKAGRSGEIGHTILFPMGKLCPCGNHGCLEQYCSEIAILQKYNELNEKVNLTLTDLKNDFYSKNKVATQLIQQFASFVAIGINNVIASFGPEKVYINSNLVRQIPDILSLIQSEMVSSFNQNIPIEQSQLGEKAILSGATALNLQKFFHVKSVRLGDTTI